MKGLVQIYTPWKHYTNVPVNSLFSLIIEPGKKPETKQSYYVYIKFNGNYQDEGHGLAGPFDSRNDCVPIVVQIMDAITQAAQNNQIIKLDFMTGSKANMTTIQLPISISMG